jgi:hypothetical protein
MTSACALFGHVLAKAEDFAEPGGEGAGHVDAALGKGALLEESAVAGGLSRYPRELLLSRLLSPRLPLPGVPAGAVLARCAGAWRSISGGNTAGMPNS